MELYIAKSGRESGPFAEEQIKPMLDSGMIELTDSIWHKDLANWIPVHQFLGLRPPVPAAPPSLPATQQAGFPSPQAIAPFPPVLPKRAISSGDPAPFWKRLVATLIDCSVLIPLTIISIVLFWTIWMSFFTAFFSDGDLSTAIGMIVGPVLGFLGWMLPIWLYYGLMESSTKQASLGKMACGLIVTGLGGERLCFKRAGYRGLGKAFSMGFFFGFIFLTCLFTERRQCLHDVRTDSLVIVK